MVIACILTVLIETGFFISAGYRNKDFILLVIFTNIFTNVAINLIVAITLSYLPSNIMNYVIYGLEAGVVLAEFLIYAFILERTRKLFILVLIANILSYVSGLFVFHNW